MKRIKEAAKRHITTIRSSGTKFKSEVKRNTLKAGVIGIMVASRIKGEEDVKK